MICIVKRDRHIGKTLRFSLFRARENNVLHAVAAKLFCTLFAEYPAHCIRHIALAAAVWSDNAGNPVPEFKNNLVGK